MNKYDGFVKRAQKLARNVEVLTRESYALAEANRKLRKENNQLKQLATAQGRYNSEEENKAVENIINDLLNESSPSTQQG